VSLEFSETAVFDPKTGVSKLFTNFLTHQQGFLTKKQGFLTQKEEIISELFSKLFF